jgi:hypothetical protein
MAICTKCGAIMHDDDALKHNCNPIDLPEKGKIKRITSTVEVVN